MRSKSILFLCSGGGGNLKFIHQAVARGWLPGVSRLRVIADRSCPAVQYAIDNGIPSACVDFSGEGQSRLMDAIALEAPDLIVTTVHKILKETVLDLYGDRLINLHYSLLPAFGGAIGVEPVRSAMSYGARFSGVTVHRVTGVLDGGRPLVQVAIPLVGEPDLDELMDVVFRAGCMALFSAVRNMFDPLLPSAVLPLKIKGVDVLVNSSPELPSELFDESFWTALK